MNENQKGTPNWLLFLFFGSLFAGLLYSIFLHGFLAYELDHSYRKASGGLYVEAKLSLVPQRTAEGIGRGEQKYGQLCVACHGSYGQYKTGLTGPNLADSQWLHNNNEKKIAALIMQGVNAAKSKTKQVMPARGGGNLNDQAVWEVVYYLSAKNSSIVKDAKAAE